MTITYTDIFCGAGGSSIGLTEAGLQLRLAANHWDRAIETHSTNFPDAEHLCADVSNYDMRRLPRTDVLWASPECFAAGTLILTARGLVPIEDVAVGDQVLTHAGRYRPVTATMNRQAATVRLSGQGNTRGLEVTTDHPVWTTTGAGVVEWTKVADIALDGSTRWATPTVYPPAEIPRIVGARPVHVEDPRFAWLVGRWLGDGSLRVRDGKSSEAFITCGKHEATDIEGRLTWVHHNCGTCAPELTWARRELRTAYVYANSHSEFARWLHEHFGQHAHGKTVPTWALGAPESWRRALLDGYLSADGHNNGRGWQAASVSKQLALGIRLLAESLGHRVSLTYSHRDTWRIEGRTGRARPQWSVQWLHHINRVTARTATEFGGHAWGVVKGIEPASTSTTVYDITVADDHSFIADGIVVHNCTWHSPAGGRKRVRAQLDLLDDYVPTDGGIRSRATAFDVIRAAEVHRYRVVIVENVVEFADWPLFGWWLDGMRKLGYRPQIISVSSAHVGGPGNPFAPQWRDRIYIFMTAKGVPVPDVRPRPLAWCPDCDQVVNAVQAWNPGRSIGKYGQQYVYRCPNSSCRNTIVEPYVLPAAAAIDWTDLGTRIGDRKRPLAAATLRRIRAGLDLFAQPSVVVNRSHNRTRGVDEPLAPLTTGRNHALAVPPLLVPAGGPRGEARSAEEPMRARLTRDWEALVTPPFAVNVNHTGDDGRPYPVATGPLPPRTTRIGDGMVTPEAFLTVLRNNQFGQSVETPLSAVTAGGGHHALTVPPGAFYVKHFTPRGAWGQMSKDVRTEPLGSITSADHHSLVIPYRRGRAKTTGEPLHTLGTRDSAALVEPAVAVEDCRFRMLKPREHLRAQRFPDSYVVTGNKGEQTMQAGNAVSSNVAHWLGTKALEALS